MGHDPKKSASPNNTIITLVIIGFLTWAYDPVTTSLFVGSQGASVPLPMRINRLAVHTKPHKPASIKAKPMTN